MQFILAALVACAALSTAAPTTDFVPRKTFQVGQVPNPRGKFVKNGPQQLMKAYNKYARIGAVAPPDVASAASYAQATGSVKATPEQYDQAYLCPVNIGGKTVNLDFDTGSADL